MDDFSKRTPDDVPPQSGGNAPEAPKQPVNDQTGGDANTANAANTPDPEQHHADKSDHHKKDGFFGKIFPRKNDGATDAGAQPGAGETATADSTPEPDLAAELAEAKEKLLRLHADFDNYRKRIAREYHDVREKAKIAVIGDFLPVYDYFQLAVAHAEQNADFNALKQGMQMILTEFKRAFDNLGAQEINAIGQEFDAKWHEAVSQEPDEASPEGHVLRQWKTGFRLGETLIRPATVVVSSGPPKPPATEAVNDDEAGATPETSH
ncbi:MAG: nucleotide exchange factor GrpE [Lentisphaeria bacterium]|nr:nucleotide exchange factor GrpE [Lentisphaeria bacterium]